MNHFRLLAIATMLMVASASVAQQTGTAPGPGEEQDHSQNTGPMALPTIEQHLKVLSEKLDLTAEQQAKIKPILQRMQEEWQSVMRDTTLSEQARHDKMKSVRDKADKQTRPILDKEQKKKLDELEQEPHPDSHGNGNGATQRPN
jgi:Spy/CpxP family protein refolding chaperone